MTITDDTLDRTLRAADPAAAPLTPAEQQAAEATLRQILATPGGAQDAPTPIRRRNPLRWLAPVAAAVTAVAALSWPHGDSGAAFASWTPTARPASPAVASDAGKGCRTSLAESLTHTGGDVLPTGVDGYRQVVTEVRGPWVFTALAAKDGSTYTCLAETASPGEVLGASGGIATSQAAPVPALGTSGFTQQSGGSYEDRHGAFTSAQGQVGSQVASVVIHADGHDTTASVTDGHFAAWWPITPGSTPEAPRYDLTLRNGQVLRDQTPRG